MWKVHISFGVKVTLSAHSRGVCIFGPVICLWARALDSFWLAFLSLLLVIICLAAG